MKKIISAIVCASALFSLVSCKKKTETAMPFPPVPVLTAKSIQKEVPIEIRSIGNVQAYSTVAIKSLVNGTLTAIHFKEGDEVRQGQLLFTIDPRPFAIQLAKSEANYQKDLAQNKNAQVEAERYKKLFEKNLISKEQADQYATNAAVMAASIDADMTDINNAKLQLQYCQIRSSVDGRAGAYLNHVGDVIKANDTTSLTTINQMVPIFAAFTVPEQYLDEIRNRQAAGALSVLAFVPQNSVTEKGTVTFINNTVDPSTGTVQIKALFQNQDRKLWPGQFVNVSITVRSEYAVIVPSQAIQTGQNGSFVFIVKPDDTAEMRPIVTGETVNNGAETIVRSGLKPEETVVTDGQLGLVNGSKVIIKMSGQSPAQP